MTDTLTAGVSLPVVREVGRRVGAVRPRVNRKVDNFPRLFNLWAHLLVVSFGAENFRMGHPVYSVKGRHSSRMEDQRTHRRGLDRRRFLKHIASVPLLLRSSPFSISPLLPLSAADGLSASIPFFGPRYVPHYPTRSPLEDVLRLVEPGSDEYLSEKYAHEIGIVLDRWSKLFESGKLSDLKASLDESFRAGSLLPVQEIRLRSGYGIATFRGEFSSSVALPADRFLEDTSRWLSQLVEHAAFEITALDEIANTPLEVRITARYSIVMQGSDAREQMVGTWQMDWIGGPSGWHVSRIQPQAGERAVVRGRFDDVTAQALGASDSYEAQMMRGVDHWRTVLDGACGIDVYGNNGVAAGDFDNDGLDDLYVCQPAGLPNRLYRNRGDGTFEDVTEQAGVGVLDNTACALFADFRNVGLQDLLVVCGSGPLLFLNQSDGTFALKRDAFRFAHTPQGTFTHAAVADYDGDGRLDIYFCLYSYYLGLDQYHYPAPYFDARNGPPNFLLHNEGDATFVDRSEVSGINVDNNRYSFACAWGEAGGNKLPDLYVVNDFGRNNLYRSNGDGTFRSASEACHVEDVGAGMSASWGDFDNNGRLDLYVANMWSAAGQRISRLPAFHAQAPEAIRALYRRHASGNALYRNQGDGSFINESEQASVMMGRWAWCSDFWDFDHDGYLDLYVMNGYITAPEIDPATHITDLASFFWRQVVGRSPEDATPSLAYEHGWNALNELIRSDNSWSGRERNVALANNHDGTFTEVSGAVGLDFLEDGRSFAVADLDGDGRLEVVVKNRNGPQLRILHNALVDLGDSIAFRLRGTKSNRDAIGACITLMTGDLRQTKYLQAGSGFLAQHSKELFFGLGKVRAEITATVRWPSGTMQHFSGLPRNSRVTLEEGVTDFSAKPFAQTSVAYGGTRARKAPSTPPESRIETWLIDPLPAPIFVLPDLAGNTHSLESFRSDLVLLHLWATSSPIYRQQLRNFEQHRRALATSHLKVLAINVDPSSAATDIRRAAEQEGLSFPLFFATEEVAASTTSSIGTSSIGARI